MSQERLRETLEALQQELESTQPSDEAARENLREAAGAIDAWLERAEPVDESLGDRLRDAVARFEGEHPTLASTIQRVVDALSDLGI